MINSYLYPLKLNFRNWLEVLKGTDYDSFWYYLNVSYDCRLMDDYPEFIVRNMGKLKSSKSKLHRPRRPYTLPD